MTKENESIRVFQIGPDGTEYFAAHSEEEMRAYYRLNSDPDTCESDLADEFQEVTNLDEEFDFDDDGEKVRTTWRKLAESASKYPCQISTGYN
jgi:hypothetical protein